MQKIIFSKHNIAFTLIELLVVIAVIGLLSTIAFASLAGAKVKARNARRISDLTALKTALDMYYDANANYPNSQGGAGPWDGIYSCWGDSTTNWIPGLVPTYLKELPRDPRNHTVCSEQYIYLSNGTDYKLISHSPEDCVTVVTNYPTIKDPTRYCWAFGFYTPGAVTW